MDNTRMTYEEYCRLTEGGEGSGNFDHEGRPGKVGGSAPDVKGKSTSRAWPKRQAPPIRGEKENRRLSGPARIIPADVYEQSKHPKAAPPSQPPAPPVNSGVNIYSGSKEAKGLAAALTNPTELSHKKGLIENHYPVFVRSQTFPDAETAYQVLKREVRNPDDMRALGVLMEEVIRAKFGQYPRLAQAITKLGGVPWLEASRHIVNGGRWEGKGRKSPFIRALIAAYEAVTK